MEISDYQIVFNNKRIKKTPSSIHYPYLSSAPVFQWSHIDDRSSSRSCLIGFALILSQFFEFHCITVRNKRPKVFTETQNKVLKIYSFSCRLKIAFGRCVCVILELGQWNKYTSTALKGNVHKVKAEIINTYFH